MHNQKRNIAKGEKYDFDEFITIKIVRRVSPKTVGIPISSGVATGTMMDAQPLAESSQGREI